MIVKPERGGQVSQPARKKSQAGGQRRQRGRPTQYDTLRKSETLLGVATDFFVEHGYSGSTIEAIAEAANMGKQAVYTRFSDKEALFQAVIRRLKEAPVFAQATLTDDQCLAEGLPRRLRAIFEDAARPYSMIVSKLALREGHRFPDLRNLMTEGVQERFTRPLAAYLRARQKAGETSNIDAAETAALLIDLIFAEIKRCVLTDSTLPKARIDAAVARITRLVLHGLCR